MNYFFTLICLLMTLVCRSQTKSISYKKLDSLSAIINGIQVRSNRKFTRTDGTIVEDDASPEDFTIYAHNYLANLSVHMKVNNQEKLYLYTDVDLSASTGITFFRSTRSENTFIFELHFPTNFIKCKLLFEGKLTDMKDYDLQFNANEKEMNTMFLTLSRLVGELKIQKGLLNRDIFEEQMKDIQTLDYEDFYTKYPQSIFTLECQKLIADKKELEKNKTTAYLNKIRDAFNYIPGQSKMSLLNSNTYYAEKIKGKKQKSDDCFEFKNKKDKGHTIGSYKICFFNDKKLNLLVCNVKTGAYYDNFLAAKIKEMKASVSKEYIVYEKYIPYDRSSGIKVISPDRSYSIEICFDSSFGDYSAVAYRFTSFID